MEPGVRSHVVGSTCGSWATRRRSVLRSAARKRARGSTFWCHFLSCMASLASHTSWPHSSTTSSLHSYRSIGDEGLASVTSVQVDNSLIGVSVSGPHTDAALQDSSLTTFFRGWSACVLGSGSTFGMFARDFACEKFQSMTSRCRDILPLPVVKLVHVPEWNPAIDVVVAVDMLNSVVLQYIIVQ